MRVRQSLTETAGLLVPYLKRFKNTQKQTNIEIKMFQY